MRIVILYFTLQLMLLFLSCKGCLEEEREALLQTKTSINIPEDSAFSNW
uniref:Uncharacterized protein n=1 Tax=Rhizophora mucronata TaxID=61149 RepID=A0A2P2MXE3_RHIMU